MSHFPSSRNLERRNSGVIDENLSFFEYFLPGPAAHNNFKRKLSLSAEETAAHDQRVPTDGQVYKRPRLSSIDNQGNNSAIHSQPLAVAGSVSSTTNNTVEDTFNALAFYNQDITAMQSHPLAAPGPVSSTTNNTVEDPFNADAFYNEWSVAAGSKQTWENLLCGNNSATDPQPLAVSGAFSSTTNNWVEDTFNTLAFYNQDISSMQSHPLAAPGPVSSTTNNTVEDTLNARRVVEGSKKTSENLQSVPAAQTQKGPDYSRKNDYPPSLSRHFASGEFTYICVPTLTRGGGGPVQNKLAKQYPDLDPALYFFGKQRRVDDRAAFPCPSVSCNNALVPLREVDDHVRTMHVFGVDAYNRVQFACTAASHTKGPKIVSRADFLANHICNEHFRTGDIFCPYCDKTARTMGEFITHLKNKCVAFKKVAREASV